MPVSGDRNQRLHHGVHAFRYALRMALLEKQLQPSLDLPGGYIPDHLLRPIVIALQHHAAYLKAPKRVDKAV